MSSAWQSNEVATSQITEVGEIQRWLELQADRFISAHVHLHFVEGIALWEQDGQFQPIALWPAQAEGVGLLDVASQALEAAQGAVVSIGEEGYGVGYPILDRSPEGDGKVVGAVAFHVTYRTSTHASNKRYLTAFLYHLEDSVSGLELDCLSNEALKAHASTRQQSEFFSLLAAVLEQPSYESAALQLTTKLSSLMRAERVSLGWRSGARTKITSISHSANFNNKMNRIRATETSMDEALDQRCPVVWPKERALEGGVAAVNRAHFALSELTDISNVLTVPAVDQTGVKAALTVEREDPFTLTEIEALSSVMALSIRALEEKRRNDRPLVLKMLVAIRGQLAALLGAGHLGYKLAAISLVAFLSYGYFATGTAYEAADATLLSESQHVISAPFQGYIDAAKARAGDHVSAGEALVIMDTRDLRLQQLQHQSQLAKLESEAQSLRAEGDRASLNILDAQRTQTEADLALVESRLQRSTLKAPFDGIIVEGDLTQQLGRAVSTGDELLRLAPEGRYRLELAVDESRVADIEEGQRGELLLAALTDRQFEFEVQRVTQETRQREGSNYFIAEATLLSNDPAFRSGMEGVARVPLGEQRRISIWTRELRQWLLMLKWRVWF
ncbi:HlyD family efflux transporter periplasmic adaptor subunit [Vreelandella andesensis]|uniref:HlyD family efflux transporter periplasmic adaptor subunit n=1 Tax=Vreelandella andesensis TaxID=447567 RepID=A0A3S0XWJ8_9GAMM|nr:HlyD family efflux transporter periplasmic adaptor subunit [Halomonas andesensis]RUR31848.1 HlyD family efflux transporter periplasmic adaptor subunit [Halomonas andesensis]